MFSQYSVLFPGKQYQSKRSNAPHYSLSQCTRQHREKVFISKAASAAQLNADTPGAIYDGAAASTLNLASGIIHHGLELV